MTYEVEQLRLSPLQRAIYDMLADGELHKKSELMTLFDELADDYSLRVMIYKLRIKLASVDEDVVCQSLGRGVGWRRVRKLIPTNGT